MGEWTGDQYTTDMNGQFYSPEFAYANRYNAQSKYGVSPLERPQPLNVNSFENKYLAEDQGIPTYYDRCQGGRCGQIDGFPKPPAPLERETVDTRTHEMLDVPSEKAILCKDAATYRDREKCPGSDKETGSPRDAEKISIEISPAMILFILFICFVFFVLNRVNAGLTAIEEAIKGYETH